MWQENGEGVSRAKQLPNHKLALGTGFMVWSLRVVAPSYNKVALCTLGQKKKELCLSFLKVKTLSAMCFFFFLVKKGYADAEIPPFFFLLHFSVTFFFFSRPLRGRFLTFFFSISRKKKMKKLKISQKPKKKKKCGKFGFLKAMRVGSWDRLFFFFGLISVYILHLKIAVIQKVQT